VALLPKERTTRKVCAESANVFAVRVQDIRFGITYCLPSIIDLASKGVVPTIWSSESGDGDFRHVTLGLKHINKITMTPQTDAERPFYVAEGNWDLLGTDPGLDHGRQYANWRSRMVAGSDLN
jgi:hypothetical protein